MNSTQGKGMPDLSQDVVMDIEQRLIAHLQTLDGYGAPEFLASGGSAAVYKVSSPNGPRAFKVFDPALIADDEDSADKRRLELQRQLIAHDCPYLVQTYNVVADMGTAFVEMEFVEWPQLKKQIHAIPDENVTSLIGQLVDAVKYLEHRGIVHRDIKPENIHISDDFTKLILLDLGVIRELENEPGRPSTDNEKQRLFLATAQYSSPEYLFRLDEPSPKLWKGLNIYQTGAVLHDLIMRRQLFSEEVELQNRWLIARAVLAKTPSFDEGNPKRLSQLKALAARCLAKDLDTRLQTVSWDDFILENDDDPLKRLRGVAVRTKAKAGVIERESIITRLNFDRSEFWMRVSEKVRAELQASCGPELPTRIKLPLSGSSGNFECQVNYGGIASVEIQIFLKWKDGIFERTSGVYISSGIVIPSLPAKKEWNTSVICECCIDEADSHLVTNISNAAAEAIMAGLDIISHVEQIESLHELDLQTSETQG